ncbi:lysophosphatidic acid receptor 6-like [Anomaloglossus baeobatrachus]|uniref:lysophosphatidic acid receptor 6-like n=1 Tax=Anomaloglossus baeobatrachus TaxID=238106 RepID=UPI003F50455E
MEITLNVPGGNCSLQADFQYGFFTVMYSLVFILGLPGNVLALYYLCQNRQRSRSANIYFVNLSAVDFVFICLLPLRIYYHNAGNNWIFGDVACRITGALFYTNIYLSIGFFTCISLDRYLAVVHPLTYMKVKCTRYSLILTVIIWIICGAITLPLILGGPLGSGNGTRTSCFDGFSTSAWQDRLAPYNTCALIFGFLLPFAIVVVFMPIFARRICRMKSSSHRKVALRIILFILVVSLICFLPYNISHLLYFMMKMDLIQDCASAVYIYKLRRITLALVSLNSCLNPTLYFIPYLSRRLNAPCTKQTYHIQTERPAARPPTTTTAPCVPRKLEPVTILGANVEWSVL